MPKPLIFPLNRVNHTDVAALQFALRPATLLQPTFMQQRPRAYQGLLAPRLPTTRPWNTTGLPSVVDAPTLVPGIVHRLLPYPPKYFVVSGITKDSNGVALPYCDVHLFRTVDDVEVDQTVSDNTGYYELLRSASSQTNYYVVAYKGGSKTLFFSNTASDLSIIGQTNLAASLDRGATAISVVAVTSGGSAQPRDGVLTYNWYSAPLRAVTISGPLTFNARVFEEFATTNYQAAIAVARTDAAGNILNYIYSAANSGVELSTVDSSTRWSANPASVTTIENGQRLKLEFGANEIGTGVDGDDITFSWNGPIPGGVGDSYVTFTETLDELTGEVPVAGTTVNTLVGT